MFIWKILGTLMKYSTKSRKGKDFAQGVIVVEIDEKRMKKNMTWLVKAIKKIKKNPRRRKCYTDTLLWYQRKRTAWVETQLNDEQLLEEIFTEFSSDLE